MSTRLQDRTRWPSSDAQCIEMSCMPRNIVVLMLRSYWNKLREVDTIDRQFLFAWKNLGNSQNVLVQTASRLLTMESETCRNGAPNTDVTQMTTGRMRSARFSHEP
jgi:hypothetical protein